MTRVGTAREHRCARLAAFDALGRGEHAAIPSAEREWRSLRPRDGPKSGECWAV